MLPVRPWRPILKGTADIRHFYTDHALYTPHHLQGSDVLVSTLQATATSRTTAELDSSSGNRTDQSLMFAGSWKLRDHAILQPYYRLEYYSYTNIHRDDFLDSLGLGPNCPLSRLVNLRVYVACDNFHTDGTAVQSSESLSAGGGVNLTVAF